MTKGTPGGRDIASAFFWCSYGEVTELLSVLYSAAQKEGARAVAAVDEFGSVLAAPIRIVVQGREGVGKSKTVQALSAALGDGVAFAESDLETRAPDSEIVLHVFNSAARTQDEEAGRAMGAAMACGVLNKCDVFLTPGDEGLWALAREAAARSAKELGMPVYPTIALLATAVVDEESYRLIQALFDAGDPTPPSAGLFLDAGRLQASSASAVGAQDRERLLRELGMYGMQCAISALHVEQYRSPAALTELMRLTSGFDALLMPLRWLVTRARARRISEFLAKLEQAAGLGVLRDELEAVLASGTVVRLRMDAAVGSGVLDPADSDIDPEAGSDPQKALQQAVRFRELATKCPDPRAAGLAWDLHVGFLWFWADLQGAHAPGTGRLA